MIPTKKFLKEFKEFALKGNVMELAIGSYYWWCISGNNYSFYG